MRLCPDTAAAGDGCRLHRAASMLRLPLWEVCICDPRQARSLSACQGVSSIVQCDDSYGWEMQEQQSSECSFVCVLNCYGSTGRKKTEMGPHMENGRFKSWLCRRLLVKGIRPHAWRLRFNLRDERSRKETTPF